jgi:hypothetical protein
MKQSFYLIFIFLLNFGLAASQEIAINGNITDSLSNPIRYSSIGVLNKSIGTVSNENGTFTLRINKAMEQDTLRISCLGYQSKDILIKEIFNKTDSSLNVQLESLINELEEVIVTSKKTKTYKRGKLRTKTKAKVIFSMSELENKNLGTEIGKKFKLGDKKVSSLKEFKFFIKENDFVSVTFRINIYSIKNNRPNKRINIENIIVKVGENYSDWVITDLSSYDINIKENIIITVEWIEHSEKGSNLNLPIIIPSLGSTHYYKFGSQNSWLKYGSLSTPMYLTYKQ